MGSEKLTPARTRIPYPGKDRPRQSPSRSPSPTVRALFEIARHKPLTIKQIAAAGQWSGAMVSNWKNGKVQPSILNVETLAAIVGAQILVVVGPREP